MSVATTNPFCQTKTDNKQRWLMTEYQDLGSVKIWLLQRLQWF